MAWRYPAYFDHGCRVPHLVAHPFCFSSCEGGGGGRDAMESLLLSKTPSCFSRFSMRPRNHGRLPARKEREVRMTRVNAPGVARCSMDAALGGVDGGGYDLRSIPKFPRMKVWDPYQRLGVTRDASEEEILEARNFLANQYAGHEGSVESIEAAYERILMASFWKRKKSKINLKSRLKKQVEESPPWIKRLLDYVEVPATDVILRRLFLFTFMGAWSIMNSVETGPAFQVALSLLSCIYFLNEKMKSVVRASITGFAALVIGWTVGSIVVPVIPSVLLQPTWTLELLTSLISYIFLFLACTFLK
ncbi:protein CHAPERONE-LIKE PROTEIN OF POR1, chloroplastic-like [Zingiber officinale]|uniref:Protein CHAPERONE-LIKE PROTEIN OF POR1, chloroplastic n=1 Tax=Zingiber officinale TaxID=94328 RepID=A0A8J5F950_ZINOF|nr:protein CHAPERONE-LIKE PROTEIN OF POR1, chloroplastic-like [Zingiber officinale]KAG6482654.1 hypothetical protein ZIOFF_059288 [Zingiber officinale]